MENYDNAIFCYYKDIITISNVSIVSTTDTQINSTINVKEPTYKDWTTYNLKIGDSVYYARKSKDSLGRLKSKREKVKIGTITSAVSSTRITLESSVSAQVLEDFKDPSISSVYVNRNPKDITEKQYYSYPIRNCVGMVGYDDDTLSIFFNRGSRLIDEVRINIAPGYHTFAMRAINKAFKHSNGKDIEFDKHMALVESKYVFGVDKVISTVPINRN